MYHATSTVAQASRALDRGDPSAPTPRGLGWMKTTAGHANVFTRKSGPAGSAFKVQLPKLHLHGWNRTQDREE